MSDVENTESEIGSKSEGSTGEEEWISVNKNMELQPLKEMKKSVPVEELSDGRGVGDEANVLSSEEGESAPSAEENEPDISVEDTHIRALLRERFLRFISKLPGQECTVNFFEKTTRTCTIRACEPLFQDIIVEDLSTCYATTVPKAIIRVGDIISMHIEVDDISRFI